MSLYILLTSFVVSIFCLAVMVFFRAWELKEGRVSFSEENKKFIQWEEIVNQIPTLKEKHLKRSYEHISRHSKKAIVHLETLSKKNPLSGQLTKAVDSVKGKNIIVKKASTSSFLKTIKEHKDKIRKEKEK